VGSSSGSVHQLLSLRLPLALSNRRYLLPWLTRIAQHCRRTSSTERPVEAGLDLRQPLLQGVKLLYALIPALIAILIILLLLPCCLQE